MAAPRQPLNPTTQSVGLTAKLVTVASVSPDGATAVTTDRMGVQTSVTMLVQRSKAPVPQPGEAWLITQDLGQWTFAAYVAATPAALPSGSSGSSGQSGSGVVTVSAQAPESPQPGDVWMDGAQGNAVFTWSGSAWVPVPLGGQALAPAAVTSAQIAPATITAAQIATNAGITAGQVAFNVTEIGGTRITTNTAQPPAPSLGDLWVNPAGGNMISVWNGNAWTPVQLGAQAIAPGSLTAAQIASGAGIGPGQVDFTASDIGGVTTSVGFVPPSSPATGDLWFNGGQAFQLQQWSGSAWTPYQFGTQAIRAGSVTAALIAADAITATQIAAGTIVAGIVNGTTIEAATFIGTTFEGNTFILNETGFFFYYGTPSSSNPPIVFVTDALTDPFGTTLPNTSGLFTWQAGLWTGLNNGALQFGSNLNSGGQGSLYASGAGLATMTGPSAASGDNPASFSLYSQSASGLGYPALIVSSGTGLLVQGNKPITLDGPLTALAGTAAVPTLIETDTWHIVQMDSGWTNGLSGSAQLSYKLMPDGTVRLTGGGQFSSNFTNQAINSAHPLPAAYRPPTVKRLPSSEANAGVNVSTTGVLSAVSAAAGQNMFCEAAYPIDI